MAKLTAKQQSELTEKQKRFCEEYLIDLNATQAAIRAGYSEETARQIGSENLSKPYIEARIQALKEERSKRTEITADNVLKELAKLAFSNPSNLYDENGDLKPIHELDYDVAASIQEIQQDQLGSEDAPVFRRKYKTADKKSSLELLGKHLKLFTDKIEINDKTVRIVKKKFDGE